MLLMTLPVPGDVGTHIQGNVLTLGTPGHSLMTALGRVLTPREAQLRMSPGSPGYRIAVVTKARSTWCPHVDWIHLSKEFSSAG